MDPSTSTVIVHDHLFDDPEPVVQMLTDQSTTEDFPAPERKSWCKICFDLGAGAKTVTHAEVLAHVRKK